MKELKKKMFALCLIGMFVLAGCGGSSGGGSAQNPPGVVDDGGTGGGGTDPTDMGSWARIIESGYEVGVRHTGNNLFARYALGGTNPTLSASSPMNQPRMAGTWAGKWAADYGGQLESRDEGDARVNVSITGSQVSATLTYSGIDVPSVSGSITTAPASVSNGRFAPRVSVNVEGTQLSFSGEGQFGGTDQKGVVGYMSGPDFRSIFYGDKQ